VLALARELGLAAALALGVQGALPVGVAPLALLALPVLVAGVVGQDRGTLLALGVGVGADGRLALLRLELGSLGQVLPVPLQDVDLLEDGILLVGGGARRARLVPGRLDLLDPGVERRDRRGVGVGLAQLADVGPPQELAELAGDVADDPHLPLLGPAGPDGVDLHQLGHRLGQGHEGGVGLADRLLHLGHEGLVALLARRVLRVVPVQAFQDTLGALARQVPVDLPSPLLLRELLDEALGALLVGDEATPDAPRVLHRQGGAREHVHDGAAAQRVQAGQGRLALRRGGGGDEPGDVREHLEVAQGLILYVLDRQFVGHIAGVAGPQDVQDQAIRVLQELQAPGGLLGQLALQTLLLGLALRHGLLDVEALLHGGEHLLTAHTALVGDLVQRHHELGALVGRGLQERQHQLLVRHERDVRDGEGELVVHGIAQSHLEAPELVTLALLDRGAQTRAGQHVLLLQALEHGRDGRGRHGHQGREELTNEFHRNLLPNSSLRGAFLERAKTFAQPDKSSLFRTNLILFSLFLP